MTKFSLAVVVFVTAAAAVALSLVSTPTYAQEEKEEERKMPHRRLIPKNRPDRQSIRKMITEKYDRQEETLAALIEQRRAAIDDHHAGRALLGDEGLEYHVKHLAGLRRKLAVSRQKDPATRALEIENDVELHEKMLLGEFIWTPGELDLVLRDPRGEFARSQLGVPIEMINEEEEVVVVVGEEREE